MNAQTTTAFLLAAILLAILAPRVARACVEWSIVIGLVWWVLR